MRMIFKIDDGHGMFECDVCGGRVQRTISKGKVYKTCSRKCYCKTIHRTPRSIAQRKCDNRRIRWIKYFQSKSNKELAIMFLRFRKEVDKATELLLEYAKERDMFVVNNEKPNKEWLFKRACQLRRVLRYDYFNSMIKKVMGFIYVVPQHPTRPLKKAYDDISHNTKSCILERIELDKLKVKGYNKMNSKEVL